MKALRFWGWVLGLGVTFLCVPALRAEDKNTDAATRQYAAAVALQNRGVYDLAAEEWVKFINTHQADSRVERAFHYLGVCYLQNAQLEPAQQCFETVVKTYPKFELLDATYLYLGLTQFKRAQSATSDAEKEKFYDAAAAALDALLQNHPQSKFLAQACYTRGDCAYHRGKKADAARFYAQALTKLPEEKLVPEITYALGVTQEDLKQADEAGKTYDEFLKKFPDNVLASEVIMRRGETLFTTGQFAAAAQWFASAAARPKFALADYATLRQAISLARMAKYAEAGDLLAAIPTKFAGSAQIAAADTTCHALARTLLKEKQPQVALALLAKVLPGASGRAQAAQLLMDQADAVADIPARHAEAVDLYAALAAKYPKDPVAPQALYLAGYGALAKGDFAAASKYATQFQADYAGNELTPDVLYVAAESLLQLGKYAEAEKIYAELLQKNPTHADADFWKVRQGTSLHLQKKSKEAVALLQTVVGQLKNPDALAEAHYLIGSGLAEQEQFADAAKSLEAAIAAQPKWRQADETLLALAHAYYRQNNAAGAKATLQKLIADFPDSKILDRAHYRLAEYAAAGNDTKSAAAEYGLVAQQWPDSPLAPHALHGQGWALFDQADFPAAEKAFDTLVEKYPGHKLQARGKYARGMARHQLGKFAAALPDLQAMLGEADITAAEKSDARYVLGLCQVGLKQPAEAAASFRALLQADPKYSAADKVYYELAWALKSLGQDKEANDAFALLVKQCPTSPRVAESQLHLGEAAYKAGNFQAAATAYAAAMDKAGKSELGERAAHGLGWAYYRLDNAAESQQAFAYQRATWPQGHLAPDAAFMEAECLFKLKKYQEALAAYARAKNLSSKDFEVLALLHSAQALGQLKPSGDAQHRGDWQKSLDLLDRLVKEFPDSSYLPEALYERGWALQNLGKFDEAQAEYAAVLAKSNGEAAARAQFMIGEIQFQQKRHSDAVKSFFLVVYGYPYPQWQADASYEAARCLEVLQKKTQAVKQYQELVEKFPQSDKTPLAKERIKALQN